MVTRIPVVESPRTRLRPLTEQDAGPLCALIFADPDVMKTLVGAGDTPEGQEAMAAEWIARWNRTWEQHGYGVWGVEIRDPSLGEPGTLIGFSGYEAPTIAGYGPELIAGRGKPWWGRGIATELAAVVHRWIFARPDIERIHSLIFAKLNPASIRLMARLGMSPRGDVPLWERVGPRYRAAMVRFELRRAPGDPEDASFKLGQLSGCPPLAPDTLRAKLREIAPGHDAEIDAAFAAPTPWAPPLYESLGPGYCVQAAKRALEDLAAGRAQLAEALEDLSAMSATVDVDQRTIRAALGHDLRGSFDEGLGTPSLALFATERPNSIID